MFGTNPIAFGWPRPDGPPFVFDFATSMVARGEIELHRRAGKTVPDDWGVDAQGNPTTDPAAILSGAMRTFGGHKGSALAAMVELLAGPLIGDMTSRESIDWDEGRGGSPLGGELIIAIDPKGFWAIFCPSIRRGRRRCSVRSRGRGHVCPHRAATPRVRNRWRTGW